ncbi:MAG: ATP-binding protein [bacterium]|nr:ATP-binding protein [bacterium]
MNEQNLFETIVEFPDSESNGEYDQLVGLDEIKNRLIKESAILLNPGALSEWSKRQHGSVIPLVKTFENRPSLFIFAGDVGTGKTTLAENFGDNLARQYKMTITFYKLSLNTRGSGTVGEMTTLISSAFEEVKSYAKKLKQNNGKYSSACIMLIDEADALAQSRELQQMHHEDRAGVNALIRGIDSITKAHLPVITVMCTNRLSAIDPAVRRRAAAIFEFDRPTKEQLLILFQNLFSGVEIKREEFEMLLELSGKNNERDYGYTYSDITQKIIPSILLTSYPDKPINFETIVKVIKDTPATTPFSEYKGK